MDGFPEMGVFAMTFFAIFTSLMPTHMSLSELVLTVSALYAVPYAAAGVVIGYRWPVPWGPHWRLVGVLAVRFLLVLLANLALAAAVGVLWPYDGPSELPPDTPRR